MSGFVYFIRAKGGEGLVKIGFATDVQKRLTALQCGSPVPLEVVLSISGDRGTEASLHRRFEAHRAHGEWFSPHAEILAFIAAPTVEAHDSFAALIRSWGIADFAAALGVQYGHAVSMVRRNSVPTWHWPRLLQAASERGIPLDASRLVAIKPPRQQNRSAA